MPAVHNKHALDPTALYVGLYVPGGHGVGYTAPITQYIPGGQISHCDASVSPGVDEYFPTGHGVGGNVSHVIEPAGHNDCVPVGQYDPAGHTFITAVPTGQ